MPYVLRGGERFFDRPEIREARLLLRGAARAGAGTRTPTPRWPTPCAACCPGSAGTPTTPPPGGAARERWESLAALVTAGRRPAWPRSPTRTSTSSTPSSTSAPNAQHVPTVQGVTLASLHSAKGLEWDAVFLVGLTDSTLPIQHATTPAQVAEERRLLYVGITRAREHLALSWALARSPGQRRGRRPSRFLDGLRPAATRARPPRRGSARRRPRPRTPSCSGGCGSGARPRPRPRACRRTSCSATPRSSPSPTRGRAAAPGWRRSPASARPSSPATPIRCWPCSAGPTRPTSRR